MYGFETMYPEQVAMEREIDLPDGYDRPVQTIYQTLPYDPTHRENLTQQHIETHPIDTMGNWTTTDGIYWTNDEEDSLFKVGYLDHRLNCNNGIASDKQYRYNCMFSTKLLYQCKLTLRELRAIASLNPDAPVRSVVTTPTYHPTVPYPYTHHIMILGRVMNSFNMCFSVDIFLAVETSVKDWIRSKSGIIMERLNYNQLCTPICDEYYDENIKFQMAIKPIFYYWAIETLIRNKKKLDVHVCQFKFMYLIGEEKRKHLNDVFPEFKDKVLTYTHDEHEYKRELLGTPNIVFYLKPGASVRSVADTLCALFPDSLDLTMHVPRFNMRLNNNVYISFGGHNTRKVNLKSLHIPDEYRHILESGNPALGHISKRFSGHTLLNDGTPNNILSYQKLIPNGSFYAYYAEQDLLDYYDTIFPPGFVQPDGPPKDPVPDDAAFLALYEGGKRTKRKRRKRRTRCAK